MLDDSPTSSQGSDVEVDQSGPRNVVDSDDEDVRLIRRHDNQSGHTSGDESEDLDQYSSIVADSDFRYSLKQILCILILHLIKININMTISFLYKIIN